MSEDEKKEMLIFKEKLKVNTILLDKFINYIKLIDLYQKKFNLIGKSTRPKIWTRHILDSAQIINYLPKEQLKESILDVGSGAGFPGIVLSILGRKDLILCDKNEKKINFLKIVANDCKLKIRVNKTRIDDFKEENIKVIISRAFAPLKTLFYNVKHIINPETILIIHKGKKYFEEIEEAFKVFDFEFKCYNSVSDPSGKIIKIHSVKAKC